MPAKETARPTAIVMNMYYTGLGIARSLSGKGVPVIGLSAHRGVYGEYTRHARIVRCADSRNQPEALLGQLMEMGSEIGHRAILFPTRDDDAVFLDRYRAQLSNYFELAIPESGVLRASLDKWETCLWAQRAQVATPPAWMISGERELRAALALVRYPCVLKPVSSHHWRQGSNWEKVGGRKAVGIASEKELLAEYAVIAQADPRALLQEMVPGGDDCLRIVACYMDRESNLAGAFGTHKLLQSPEQFGTGVIVQAADCAELLEPTVRLLKTMQYTGIAEVEYKWDSAAGTYQLIEINPRPWDQHRLGDSCGVSLVYLAYCELAGRAMPAVRFRNSQRKWIAEDAFVMAALGMLWKRDPRLGRLFRLARGKRLYAIWSASDPLPLLVFLLRRFLPGLIGTAGRSMFSAMRSKWKGGPPGRKKDVAYVK